jgi:hypothetical protein
MEKSVAIKANMLSLSEMTMNDTPQPPEFSQYFADSRADPLRRIGEEDAPWLARPWLMALIGAVTGLLFWLLAERWDDALGERLMGALVAALLIVVVSFLLSVEPRRWRWALIFSLFWGGVGGLIFWQAMGGNGGREPFAWPFVSVVLAILIATPFFQTQRDAAVGTWRIWRLPYDRLHDHAWIDAVLGAAALVFIGLCFAMLALIGGLFSLIGIEFVAKLFERGWFMLSLAGAAFGAAVGLLRERDRLVSVLQRLVMVVLSVLAPVLAAALVIFLLSLPFTGLEKLWNGGFSAAYLLLTVAAASLLLANSVIGNGHAEVAKHRVMRGSAAILAVAVLPLAGLAAIAMALRIEQYGWTPSRLWGVVAVGVALAYGAAGLLAVVRGRGAFAAGLRDAQEKLAVAVMALAFFLALPILDFGAISARDQLARLNSGAVKAKDFDWAAMAYDFGPSGRRALERMAKGDDAELAKMASNALNSDSRFAASEQVRRAQVANIKDRLQIVPKGTPLPQGLHDMISQTYVCGTAAACAAVQISPQAWAVLVQAEQGGPIVTRWFAMHGQGWQELGSPEELQPSAADSDGEKANVRNAKLEVREVTRRQIFIDGQPSSGVF